MDTSTVLAMTAAGLPTVIYNPFPGPVIGPKGPIPKPLDR